MKKNGYREMLRDRMPKTLSLALKWCHAKERWLSYVYETWIKTENKSLRATRVKQCLGIKPRYNQDDLHAYMWKRGVSHGRINKFVQSKTPQQLSKVFTLNFHDTIKWKELTEEDRQFWERVESWVNWFRAQYGFIENAYEISRRCGENEDTIKVEIISSYLHTLLPTEKDSKEVAKAKEDYVNKLVDFLYASLEHV